MLHLRDSFVLRLMWPMSSWKVSSSPSHRPPSPFTLATGWMRSHTDQAKCAFGLVYKPLPNSIPLQALHSELQTLFLVKGPGLKCPMQPRRSCSRTTPFFCTKEERGPGSQSTFVQNPPHFFSSLCPLMRVFKCWLWLLFLACVGEGLHLLLQAQAYTPLYLLLFCLVLFILCLHPHPGATFTHLDVAISLI